MSETYTDAECVAALQEAAEQLEQSPTRQEYRSLSVSPCVDIMKDGFGTWKEAKEAAGLPICRYGRDRPCYRLNEAGYMQGVI